MILRARIANRTPGDEIDDELSATRRTRPALEKNPLCLAKIEIQDYSLDACRKEADTDPDDSEGPMLLPSDLGVGMSVCIAAISRRGPDGRHEIVAITDRKVSSTEFSNEDATIKAVLFSKKWMAMFAGEDISPVVPITRRAKKTIRSQNENTLENVVAAMETAYQEHLSDLCLLKVLGRWKFKSMEEFREVGKKQFGMDGFDRLCHQIEQVRLRCTFLVCGIDEDRHAHIFTVSNPGIAEIRDDPGYWAIGNGGHAALSLMSFFEQSIIKSPAETIYNVFTAKLMSENASDVGGREFPWKFSADGWDTGLSHIFQDVRKEWNRIGKPSITPEIIQTINARLDALKQSDDQTSAG